MTRQEIIDELYYVSNELSDEVGFYGSIREIVPLGFLDICDRLMTIQEMYGKASISL